MKGNKKILIARARSHGLTKDNFIRNIAIKNIVFIDRSYITLLKLTGKDIPKHFKTKLPDVIEKKCDMNTEFLPFNLTEKEYAELEYTARSESFTSTGGIGLLLDKVAMFDIIFEKGGEKQ